MANMNLKLRALCVIVRHGRRAPIRFLPNDPNVGHYPEGKGNLTKNGQIEMYNLGRVLRERYNDFLPDKPFARDVYVRSTDVDRSLVSAQCCLAGLYPPMNDVDKLSLDLNWQPVSVHTVTYANDPLAIQIHDKFELPPSGSYEDPICNDLYKTFLKHLDLWNYMAGIANTKGKFLHTLFALDAALVEARDKLAIPDDLQGRLEDMEELFCTAISLFSIAHFRSRLCSGCLLTDIVNMVEILQISTSNSSASAPKTLIYSLHDYNLIALTAHLCKENIQCPTASCILLEVYEDVDSTSGDKLYVKMKFLNKHDKDPVEMKFQIGGHSSTPSPIVSFTEFTQFAHTFVKNTPEINHQLV